MQTSRDLNGVTHVIAARRNIIDSQLPKPRGTKPRTRTTSRGRHLNKEKCDAANYVTLTSNSNQCSSLLSHSEHRPFRVAYSWSLYASMTTSTKPEVIWDKRIATPEDDRATAIGNLHTKFTRGGSNQQLETTTLENVMPYITLSQQV